jgi:hypothetical protein
VLEQKQDVWVVICVAESQLDAVDSFLKIPCTGVRKWMFEEVHKHWR